MKMKNVVAVAWSVVLVCSVAFSPREALADPEDFGEVSGDPDVQPPEFPQKGAVNTISAEELPAEAQHWLRVSQESKKNKFAELARSAVSRIQEGRQALMRLRGLERRCHRAAQAFVVIDGGSSATRASVFLATTLACPHQGRRVIPSSIRLIATGERHPGLREVLEKWLDKHAGQDWESREVDSRLLLRNFRHMLETAQKFMKVLEDEIVGLMERELADEQKRQVQALGVPVILYSTAGVRDFHDWYRDGFFVALRFALNHFTNTAGYKFFTTPELTRPISGAEEGLYAFMTLNHLTGRLTEESSYCTLGADGMQACRSELAGVLEFGGASAQVVFPVAPADVLPSSVKAVNLQRERLLPERYPQADVVSVSFMQVGVASSAGLFLKQVCSEKEFLNDGICYNPCFFKGYEQDCSAGDVSIDPLTGDVTVSTETRKNKLKPIATYCSLSNSEIRMKATNEMLCRENRIDPSQPLEQRLQFEGCKRIKGTGDFDRCYALVERFIVGPKYPLPANIEAASSGFESLKQVFQFASTSAAMVITGGAMVGSIRVLKRANLLGSSFSGDPHELEKAARIFCGASVKVEDGKGAAIHLPNHHEKLGVWTYDICKVIAMNVALVKHMMAAEKRPASISWEKSVKNDEGVEVADLGWHVGAILQQILDVEKFGRMAYESGWTYNL